MSVHQQTGIIFWDTQLAVFGDGGCKHNLKEACMFFGAVEAGNGEVLNIRHPNGNIGGNPILALSTALRNYCNGVRSADSDWIKRLESHGQEPLCSVCAGLLAALIEGEWEYGSNYDLYLHRSGAQKMSREEFSMNVARRDNAWVEIRSLLNCVHHLLGLIKADNPNDFDWNDPAALVLDLEALIQTLSLLAERGAKEVRILIF